MLKKLLGSISLVIAVAAFFVYRPAISSEPKISSVLIPAVEARTVSDAVSSPFLFTAIAVHWDGAEEAVWQFRFLQDDIWTPWERVGNDADADGQEVFLTMNPSSAFQFSVSKEAKNIRIAIMKSLTPVFGNFVRAAGGFRIISRKEWGADESFRVYKKDRSIPKLVPVNGEYLEKFADELQIVRKVEKSENGEDLTWPLQYPKKVSKIIIHHTVTTKNLENPSQAVRDIYAWHTFGRGWGDIGYNYMIAPNGNVYEGRAGGEGVIGAHAGTSNTGSIGIAVLGNYETGEVSDAARQSLIELIREKSLIHGIDPNAKSLWRGEIMENVIGHRDVMPTTCPGKNLYAALNDIRKLASQTTQIKTKPIFVSHKKQGFDFALIDAPKILSLGPEEKTDISVTIENKGMQTWEKGTYFVVVSSDGNLKRMVAFSSPDFPRIAMLKSSLKTGERFSLTTKISSLAYGGVTELTIVPVINGALKLGKFVRIPVYVKPPVYAYDVIAQKNPPEILKLGETFSISLTLKNTGNVAWKKSSLLSKSVAPGEAVALTIPFTPNKTDAITYDPLSTLRQSMPFTGASTEFHTYIYKEKYAAKPIGFLTNYTVQKGTTELFVVSLKNIGGVTWTKQSFPVLKPVGEKTLLMQNFVMLEESVKPGEIATIQFAVKISDKTGKETFLAMPYVGKIPMMKMNLHFTIQAVDEKKNMELRQSIRVKLSFKGEPIVIGNGRFEVFENGKKIKTLEKDQVFSVKAGTKSIFRFQPLGMTILEIKNWERRPTWNMKLNDNRFRGVLEVRQDNSELIMVNELAVEQYVRGLAETPNSDPIEKIKAIVTVARTYALFYAQAKGADRKFPGKPYDLSDDPARSQKYLGYGYELRTPNVKKAALATKGLVVKYNGKIVKTPYFSQSNGKTRSAFDAWGWTHTPYLQSVDDPDCKGLEAKGHAVGMSGCGAYARAMRGETFEQILKYYYKGVEIKKVSDTGT